MQVRVRALPGRIVKTQPVGGKRITNDTEGELVERTSWIDRAIEVYGDLEIVQEKPPVKKKPVPADAPAPSAPETKE